MKIRTLSEAQARRSWTRLMDLQLRGYAFLIERRGKVIARIERIKPTIFSSNRRKKH